MTMMMKADILKKDCKQMNKEQERNFVNEHCFNCRIFYSSDRDCTLPEIDDDINSPFISDMFVCEKFSSLGE